jgi:hypothetical protein
MYAFFVRLTFFRPLFIAGVWTLVGSCMWVGSTRNAWPAIAGRVGPYGGIRTVDDANRMTADGLKLTLLSSTAPEILAALREGGAGYIDLFFWEQMYQKCKAQFEGQQATHRPLACNLSIGDRQAVTQAAAAHLHQVELDPGLVAFWILDDYPHGDISLTLKMLHDLVTRSNAASGFTRATICGVGGSLDAKQSPDDWQFVSNRRYTENSLINVSPAACDLVSPYFYGTAPADDPRLIDWSMKDLMPYFLQKLRDKGFNTSTRLLLPVDHAFSYKAPNASTFYVMPRPDDIAAQMKAYCDAGAFSMLFFTWQSHDADRSYSNNDAIRAGVQKGRAGCLNHWSQFGSLP